MPAPVRAEFVKMRRSAPLVDFGSEMAQSRNSIVVSQSTGELDVKYRAGGLLVAMIGPVCLALWRSKPTPELFEVQRSLLHAAVARQPGKTAFLCVVEPKAEPPDEAERKASAQMITSQGENLAGVACVIEGNGFRAAITRTVLSGVVFMIRTPSPIKLFDGVRVAAPWLARWVGRSALPDLEREVERGRALL